MADPSDLPDFIREALQSDPDIGWTPLSSSNLNAYRYDSSTQTLRIRFNRGDVYAYHVPNSDVVDGLASASSHGIYFNSNIRNNYPYYKE